DNHDKQAGHCIATHEFAGAVHGAVELGLLGDFGTAAPGLVLAHQARVQVGIDGHLLARHGVQGETRPDLGDTPRALCNHHEVDDDQNHEHHDTNGEVAA